LTEKQSGGLKTKIFIFVPVFLLVVLLITSFFGKKGLVEIYRAKKNYAALVQEIDRLKQEKKRLEKEIAELEANPKAVDQEAREKLWLMKPEEKVIIKKRK
jgi:cell division protein FtsB